MGWTTPNSSRGANYVVTTTDWNDAEADLAYLYGDAGWTTVASFSNGWSAGVGFPPAYILIGRVVYLRGKLSAGTAATTAFTLPTGYCPSLQVTLAQSVGTTTVNQLVITTGGLVQPLTSVDTWLDLSFAVV